MHAAEIKRSFLWYPLAILVVPITAIAALLALGEYQEWRYVRPWRQVGHGDSEQRVMELLGTPHSVEAWQSEQASWESDHKIEYYNAEVKERFRYLPLSFSGEEYCVGFDHTGHATSKYHISSP